MGTSWIRPRRIEVSTVSPPDNDGYWLVGSDGELHFSGQPSSTALLGAIHLNQPIVGMAATPDGKGYWMVARDGGIFSFGDAPFTARRAEST